MFSFKGRRERNAKGLEKRLGAKEFEERATFDRQSPKNQPSRRKIAFIEPTHKTRKVEAPSRLYVGEYKDAYSSAQV
jgi:hypothetical protein